MECIWHMPTLRSCGCGLSRRARELARGLAEAGWTVRLAVAADRTDVTGGRLDGLEVVALAPAGSRSMHWSLQALARSRSARSLMGQLVARHDLFLSCQPEALTAYRRLHGPQPTVFVCGGTSLLNEPGEIGAGRSTPALNRAAMRIDRRLRRRNERAAFCTANAVVFDSHHTRHRVMSEYAVPGSRFRTIHGGVDAERFRPPTANERLAARTGLGLSPRDFAVAWCGRLSPEKNLPLLIRAVGEASDAVGRLLLVGDGPQRRELETLVGELGLGHCVHFAGLQNDVRPYLHAADAFAFPSTGESFGGALVEAMACGLACVVARPGACVRNASEEIIGDARCALCVAPSACGLASAFRRLARRPSARAELGRRARQRAAACFTWVGARREFNEIVAAVMNGRAVERHEAAGRDCLPAALACAGRG